MIYFPKASGAVLLGALVLSLGACSYTYDLRAVVKGGQVIFEVASDSKSQPDCLRQIAVEIDERTAISPAPGDDPTRTGYGTVWYDSVDYDEACANAFPMQYGANLKGRKQTDRGLVSPKPLKVGVVYVVSSTTGATGYGGGRFILHANGRIENLRNQ